MDAARTTCAYRGRRGRDVRVEDYLALCRLHWPFMAEELVLELMRFDPRTASFTARPSRQSDPPRVSRRILEHVVSPVRLRRAGRRYIKPRLDVDLLLTTATLHDVGETRRVVLRARHRLYHDGTASRSHRHGAETVPRAIDKMRFSHGAEDRGTSSADQPPRAIRIRLAQSCR